MAWGKAGTTTLSSAGDSVSSGTFTASKCNQSMTHISDVGGQLAVDMRFNSDTGNNYAFRRNNDGGTDATTAPSSHITLHSSEVTEDLFSNLFIINISSDEKLVIGRTIQNHTVGASNTPKRKEFVGKWANTSSQITQIDFSTYSGSGDYATGSNLTVLGSEVTPAAAITFPTNVQVGSRAEITDSRKIYSRMDSDYETAKWFELGTVPYAGGRGVFGGGSDGSITNTMQYITIATPSNATDFGDLTVARTYVEAVSSITRGVFGGGYGSADENTMDYITFSTPSNATDFGNLTVARHALAGVSSGTRGVFGGGNGSNVMDYITIATPSNATDFGDLSVTRQDLAGVSSDTRGVFAGGDGSNVMDYITISTPSNATDFGDLLSNLRYPADVSNGTRGVFAGGDPAGGTGNTNVIQYITIASTGNATDFGDLTVGRHAPAGVESDTRGVIGGGYSGSNSNVMDYITIATTGNAIDFGDLTAATNHLGGASRF